MVLPEKKASRSLVVASYIIFHCDLLALRRRVVEALQVTKENKVGKGYQDLP